MGPESRFKEIPFFQFKQILRSNLNKSICRIWRGPSAASPGGWEAPARTGAGAGTAQDWSQQGKQTNIKRCAIKIDNCIICLLKIENYIICVKILKTEICGI